MEKGIFPDDLKLADVLPLFKKEDCLLIYVVLEKNITLNIRS